MFYTWKNTGGNHPGICKTHKQDSHTSALPLDHQFPKSLTDFLTWPQGHTTASKTNIIRKASRGCSSEKRPGAKTGKEDCPTSGDVQGSIGQRANIGSISNIWSYSTSRSYPMVKHFSPVCEALDRIPNLDNNSSEDHNPIIQKRFIHNYSELMGLENRPHESLHLGFPIIP